MASPTVGEWFKTALNDIKCIHMHLHYPNDWKESTTGHRWVQGSSVHVKSGSFVHVRRLVVCARFCCVFLSLYLCNMILLLVFF